MGVQGVDLSNYNFLGIGPTDADLAESVKEDVHKLRASPLIPKQVPIYGFVYDVKVRPPGPACMLGFCTAPAVICRSQLRGPASQ